MADTIRAELQGVDEGLEDALDSVKNASEQVGKSLDRLDDTLKEISGALEGTSQATNDVKESFNDATQATQATDRAVDSASSEFRSAIDDIRGAASSLDEAAQGFLNVAGTAETAETATDRQADEAREAAGSNLLLMQANELLSGSNIQTALTSDRAKEGIQDMGDAANNATGDLVGAASASELLNLQTSALSINVGAFTIALRNLTTEIPALVATLGNLSAALGGVAGGFAAIGAGGAALALGGFLAKAEQLEGPLEGAGDHLEAMGDIADNIKDTFIEALQPLLETEGIIEVFENTIEDLANIVQSFAETVQYTFEESFEDVDGTELQSLSETMKGISDAVMGNIDAITAAIGDMVVRLGDDVVGMMETLFEALPGFIRGVTVVTEELISIFSEATDSLPEFTSELMELGRAIAAGVAPVLDTFFNVVSGVVESINELGAENIATAAKVVTLLLAVDRLSSIMGSLILPITQVAGSLVKINRLASNPLDAFVRTVSESIRVTRELSSGMDGLATAFEQIIQPVTEGTSLLDTLNEYIKGADDPLGALANRFDDNTESVGTFNSAIDGLLNKFSSLSSGITFPDLGDEFSRRGLGDDIEEGDIISPTDLRRSLIPTFESFKVDESLQFISEGGANQSLTGLDAIRQRLVILNDAFFKELGQMERTVNSELSSINSRFGYVAGGIRNRVQSITDSVSFLSFSSLLPSSDDLIDQLMRPFNRVSQIDFAGKFDFLDKINEMSFADFKSSILSTVPSLAGFKSSILSTVPSLAGFKSSILSTVPSLDGLRQSINSVIMGQSALSVSSIRSAISLGIFDSAAENANGAFKRMRQGIASNIPFTEIFTTSIAELAASLILSGGASARFGRSLKFMRSIMVGNITLTKGLRGAVASLAGVKAGASATTIAYGFAQTFAAGATSLLTGALYALLSPLAIIIGALAVLIALVGTAGAVLGSLGKSGKSAKDVMDGLKNTLVSIGETVMPAVTGASEMMLNVFKSIATPVMALIDGFKEIAVALGLIDESAGEGSGMMGMLDSAVQALLPIMDTITELNLLIGGVLTNQIESATESIVGFINKFNIGEHIGESFSIIMSLAGPVMNALQQGFDSLMGIINATIDVLSFLLSNLMGGLTFVNDLLGGLIGGLLGVESGAAGVVGILMSGFEIVVDVIGTVINSFAALFDIIGSILNIVGDVFGGVIGVIKNLASIVGNVLIASFSRFGEIARTIIGAVVGGVVNNLKPALNGIVGVINTIKGGLETVADIFGSVIDYIVNLWNEYLGGTTVRIPKTKINVPGGGKVKLGGDKIFSIPTIGGGPDGSSAPSDTGEGGGPSLGREELSGSDIAAGGEAVANGAKSVMGGMGRSPNVNVDEGDTTNVFNQNISADPEDKAQIGRIAKDAMEEANSFKRRQQGRQ